MPVKKKSKTKTTKDGYVSEAEGTKFSDLDTSEFEGKSVSFDAHDITSKIIEFGRVLTGVTLYTYQEESAYAIIYSVITFSKN